MYKCLNGEVNHLQPGSLVLSRCVNMSPVSTEPYKCVQDGGYGVEIKRLENKKSPKDCKLRGKIYKHEKTFFYPPTSCQLQRCRDGTVKYLKTVCSFRGRCYEIG
ncbi:hypothetical protein PoB_004392000 [Plakobranchus ocellatus]|uniref:SUEL-type lectin domain-containing protein n=1 Tax=Plakobranchus ocellatus TaxID=259542 RepID=A0AAV4BE74_9GAST|nr:hypothetical protein PoB_004392000 [Plakobranchus ocellatus]